MDIDVRCKETLMLFGTLWCSHRRDDHCCWQRILDHIKKLRHKYKHNKKIKKQKKRKREEKRLKYLKRMLIIRFKNPLPCSFQSDLTITMRSLQLKFTMLIASSLSWMLIEDNKVNTTELTLFQRTFQKNFYTCSYCNERFLLKLGFWEKRWIQRCAKWRWSSCVAGPLIRSWISCHKKLLKTDVHFLETNPIKMQKKWWDIPNGRKYWLYTPPTYGFFMVIYCF